MNYLNNDHNSKYVFIALGLFIAALVLAISAMFSAEDPIIKVSHLAVQYATPTGGLDVSISQGIRLMVLGVFSGLVGGMMGMGGGIIKASGLLIVFGVDILVVRSVALITNVFIYGSATYRNAKKEGLILRKIVELMIPGAMIGVALGFILGNIMYSHWLQRLLGLFALVSGLEMLRRLYFTRALESFKRVVASKRDEGVEKGKVIGAGFPMGMVMGLFGISGGVVGVPLQQFLLKIPIKNAIANSSVTSLVASVVAVICALWYESSYGEYGISTPIIIALWIIPGNVIGAQVGAYLTSILPARVVKLFYVVIMVVIGIRLLF